MADVTIGAVTYSAFEDVAGADEYLGGDVARAVTWAARNADAKGRGLVSATRMLLALPWCGTPPDPATDPAPDLVQQITAELAADLLAKPRLFADASGDSNVKSAKAGSAQVEFFAPVDGGPPLPRAMWDRLVAAGLVCLNSAGDLDVTLDGAQAFGTCEGVRPLGGRYPWDWPITSVDFD